jgi:hypothetical protein
MWAFACSPRSAYLFACPTIASVVSATTGTTDSPCTVLNKTRLIVTEKCSHR